ncbi:MAG: glycosyltransferase family 2 protein [Flavobacteriaceae bacterium]|nr:glycosyltransferase family 2 protein [Flavobacteriaceae bacterium]
MLFDFQKYIQPTWYFNLKPTEGDIGYLANYEKLQPSVQALFEPNKNYQTKEAYLLDLAYQGWHKGVIHIDKSQTITVENPCSNVADNYLFLRSHYHKVWSVYVLLLRLLGLKNPLREIAGFMKARNQHRVLVYDKIFDHSAYDSFDSPLLKANPMVTVVIPTLNRYDLLDDVMKDLENQDYKNFEVICVDQTEPFNEAFYQNRKLNLTAFYQKEKALWLARNTALKMAKGSLILLYDDDSRVEPDWISQHIKCLDFFQAELSAGISISVIGSEVPANYKFFRWSDQLDTGNVMLRRAVFEKTGLFDRQFEKQRMGDGEFGLRAYLMGFKNISNPKAWRLHLKAAEGGLRQMGSWDAWRPKKFWSPRPIPSVLYFYRKYFGIRFTLLESIKNVPPSIIHLRFKRSKPMMLFGLLLGLCMFPVLIYQFVWSWRLASKKLKEGARVEKL